jgi:serine/threonine-protein kinase
MKSPEKGPSVLRSENNGGAKKQPGEVRKAKDTNAIAKTVKAPEEKKAVVKPEKPVEAKTEKVADRKEEAGKMAGEQNTSEAGTVDLYKVRNKAYFHNEPDAATRREAFIVHWNNATLKPLEDKNGFVYIVFTNHQGQVSKGWISKADLVQVK